MNWPTLGIDSAATWISSTSIMAQSWTSIAMLLSVPQTALVSCGGIDAQYINYFGRKIEDRVKQVIAQRHAGELLVGAADVVETDDLRFPFLIVAPTMRVPMILKDSVNPYLAARAVFPLMKNATGLAVSGAIQTVAFPGLGTGVGQMPPNTCARQMRAAIEEVVLGGFIPPQTWLEASERHQLLYTDRLRRLQIEN